MTGSATDIAVGKDGVIWAVGATAAAGGFPVYRWSGSTWVKSSGAGVKVAADPNGLPWLVTSTHAIYFGSPSACAPAPRGGRRAAVWDARSATVVGSLARVPGDWQSGTEPGYRKRAPARARAEPAPRRA